MNASPPIVIEVGCAIIRRNHELLIAQRKHDDHLGGYWEFPGGKRHRGETLEACLIREAQEELGIIIAPVKFFREVRHSYPERVLSLNFYLCDWVSGDACAIDCHDYKWILPENLKDYRFPPADDGIIEELIRNKAEYFK